MVPLELLFKIKNKIINGKEEFGLSTIINILGFVGIIGFIVFLAIAKTIKDKSKR